MTTREVILDGGSPWGFRMHGGADVHQPLRISRVNPGSKASLKGIREGDLISSINGQSTKDVTNSEAHALLKSAGDKLKLGLNEDGGGSPKRRSQVKTVLQETHSETIKRSTVSSTTYTVSTSNESSEPSSEILSPSNEKRPNGVEAREDVESRENGLVSQRSTLSSTDSTPTTNSSDTKGTMADSEGSSRSKRRRKSKGKKSRKVVESSSYRVESPKTVEVRKPQGQMVKSRSLEDEETLRITELSGSESETAAECSAVIVESCDSDVDWEVTEELEVEATKTTPESIKEKRLKRREELSLYFMPAFQNPRLLDAISEEGSDLSDRESKVVKKQKHVKTVSGSSKTYTTQDVVTRCIPKLDLVTNPIVQQGVCTFKVVQASTRPEIVHIEETSSDSQVDSEYEPESPTTSLMSPFSPDEEASAPLSSEVELLTQELELLAANSTFAEEGHLPHSFAAGPNKNWATQNSDPSSADDSVKIQEDSLKSKAVGPSLTDGAVKVQKDILEPKTALLTDDIAKTEKAVLESRTAGLLSTDDAIKVDEDVLESSTVRPSSTDDAAAADVLGSSTVDQSPTGDGEKIQKNIPDSKAAAAHVVQTREDALVSKTFASSSTDTLVSVQEALLESKNVCLLSTDGTVKGQEDVLDITTADLLSTAVNVRMDSLESTKPIGPPITNDVAKVQIDVLKSKPVGTSQTSFPTMAFEKDASIKNSESTGTETLVKNLSYMCDLNELDLSSDAAKKDVVTVHQEHNILHSEISTAAKSDNLQEGAWESLVSDTCDTKNSKHTSSVIHTLVGQAQTICDINKTSSAIQTQENSGACSVVGTESTQIVAQNDLETNQQELQQFVDGKVCDIKGADQISIAICTSKIVATGQQNVEIVGELQGIVEIQPPKTFSGQEFKQGGDNAVKLSTATLGVVDDSASLPQDVKNTDVKIATMSQEPSRIEDTKVGKSNVPVLPPSDLNGTEAQPKTTATISCETGQVQSSLVVTINADTIEATNDLSSPTITRATGPDPSTPELHAVEDIVQSEAPITKIVPPERATEIKRKPSLKLESLQNVNGSRQSSPLNGSPTKKSPKRVRFESPPKFVEVPYCEEPSTSLDSNVEQLLAVVNEQTLERIRVADDSLSVKNQTEEVDSTDQFVIEPKHNSEGVVGEPNQIAENAAKKGPALENIKNVQNPGKSNQDQYDQEIEDLLRALMSSEQHLEEEADEACELFDVPSTNGANDNQTVAPASKSNNPFADATQMSHHITAQPNNPFAGLIATHDATELATESKGVDLPLTTNPFKVTPKHCVDDATEPQESFESAPLLEDATAIDHDAAMSQSNEVNEPGNVVMQSSLVALSSSPTENTSKLDQPQEDKLQSPEEKSAVFLQQITDEPSEVAANFDCSVKQDISTSEEVQDWLTPATLADALNNNLLGLSEIKFIDEASRETTPTTAEEDLAKKTGASSEVKRELSQEERTPIVMESDLTKTTGVPSQVNTGPSKEVGTPIVVKSDMTKEAAASSDPKLNVSEAKVIVDDAKSTGEKLIESIESTAGSEINVIVSPKLRNGPKDMLQNDKKQVPLTTSYPDVSTLGSASSMELYKTNHSCVQSEYKHEKRESAYFTGTEKFVDVISKTLDVSSSVKSEEFSSGMKKSSETEKSNIPAKVVANEKFKATCDVGDNLIRDENIEALKEIGFQGPSSKGATKKVEVPRKKINSSAGKSTGKGVTKIIPVKLEGSEDGKQKAKSAGAVLKIGKRAVEGVTKIIPVEVEDRVPGKIITESSSKGEHLEKSCKSTSSNGRKGILKNSEPVTRIIKVELEDQDQKSNKKLPSSAGVQENKGPKKTKLYRIVDIDLEGGSITGSSTKTAHSKELKSNEADGACYVKSNLEELKSCTSSSLKTGVSTKTTNSKELKSTGAECYVKSNLEELESCTSSITKVTSEIISAVRNTPLQGTKALGATSTVESSFLDKGGFDVGAGQNCSETTVPKLGVAKTTIIPVSLDNDKSNMSQETRNYQTVEGAPIFGEDTTFDAKMSCPLLNEVNFRETETISSESTSIETFQTVKGSLETIPGNLKIEDTKEVCSVVKTSTNQELQKPSSKSKSSLGEPNLNKGKKKCTTLKNGHQEVRSFLKETKDMVEKKVTSVTISKDAKKGSSEAKSSKTNGLEDKSDKTRKMSSESPNASKEATKSNTQTSSIGGLKNTNGAEQKTSSSGTKKSTPSKEPVRVEPKSCVVREVCEETTTKTSKIESIKRVQSGFSKSRTPTPPKSPSRTKDGANLKTKEAPKETRNKGGGLGQKSCEGSNRMVTANPKTKEAPKETRNKGDGLRQKSCEGSNGIFTARDTSGETHEAKRVTMSSYKKEDSAGSKYIHSTEDGGINIANSGSCKNEKGASKAKVEAKGSNKNSAPSEPVRKDKPGKPENKNPGKSDQTVSDGSESKPVMEDKPGKLEIKKSGKLDQKASNGSEGKLGGVVKGTRRSEISKLEDLEKYGSNHGKEDSKIAGEDVLTGQYEAGKGTSGSDARVFNLHELEQKGSNQDSEFVEENNLFGQSEDGDDTSKPGAVDIRGGPTEASNLGKEEKEGSSFYEDDSKFGEGSEVVENADVRRLDVGGNENARKEHSPSMSSGTSSEVSTQVTVKRNQMVSSIGDVEELVKDMEYLKELAECFQPATLRDTCLRKLVSLPFGQEVLEELADVSKDLEEFTNTLPAKQFRISNKANFTLTVEEKQKWFGLPTEESPGVLVCLSPTQKEFLDGKRKVAKEADKLLELHQKFLDRRSCNEAPGMGHKRTVGEQSRLLDIILEEGGIKRSQSQLDLSEARSNARDLSEWLHLARNDAHKQTANNRPRRSSLPNELYVRQMQQLIEKEKEIQRELEELEEEKRKLGAEMQRQFEPSDYKISKNGDIAVHDPKSGLRQKMYEEYMSEVAAREERKQMKVIKISLPEDEAAATKQSVNEIEHEFMDKVKARMDKYGLKSDDANESSDQDDLEKGKVLIVDEEGAVTEAKKLPKHIKELVDIRVHDDGIWSPGQRASFNSEELKREVATSHDSSKDKSDESIPPVWTPRSAGSSPTAERKEFRPVNFESPILGRKARTKSDGSANLAQTEPPWKITGGGGEVVTTPSGTFVEKRLPTSYSAPGPGFSESVSRLPKAQNPTITLLQKAREGQIPKGAAYIEQERARRKNDSPFLSSSDLVYQIRTESVSDSDSERPRKITISPKKYEGIGPTTKDGMPLILRSEVRDANMSQWYKKMYDTIHKQRPTRYEDDEYVMVRYKQRRGRYPYATGYLSEPEPGAYDSDAALSDSKYATLDRRRPASTTINNNKGNEYYMSSTLPRNSASTTTITYRPDVQHSTEIYKNQPGRIENYTPGQSSISEKEAKKWWDEVMDIFDGHLEQQKRVPQTKGYMSQALKESGYESDSTLVFRRRDDGTQQLSPMEQREVYKNIQKGGDVPLHGLRKPAPERPKEPEYPPPPPPKGQSNHINENGSESPRKYVENEVTIHYRTPVRQEVKEALSEDELARRQADAMRKIYEEERRRKYLQVSHSDNELHDMNSRRHTDNFIPSQKSPIPLNRYDDFLDDLSPRMKPRPRSPEPRLVARALYNFVGQTSRELTFKKGDVIYIRRQVDKNWYEGEFNAMIGLFPANYVEVVPYDGIKITPRKPHEGQARAKYNFIAQTHLELSLAKGELVVVTRRVDDNWFEGKIGARKGIFPVSYVEVLIDPGDPPPPSSQPPVKPVASPASHSLLLNGSSGGKESMGSHNYVPTFPTQDLGMSYRAKPVQVTGGGGSYGSLKKNHHPVDQALHIDTQNEPIPYRALYKYRPQNEDELELLEGDTVYVLEKCDDGWYVGSSERTGAFGTFPGNYVERI